MLVKTQISFIAKLFYKFLVVKTKRFSPFFNYHHQVVYY
jgi:hypothetical protein